MKSHIEPHWLNRQEAAILCGMSGPSFDRLIRPYITEFHGGKCPDGKKIEWNRYSRLECLTIAERYWSCSKRPAQSLEDSTWDANDNIHFFKKGVMANTGSTKRSGSARKVSAYEKARGNVISNAQKR